MIRYLRSRSIQFCQPDGETQGTNVISTHRRKSNRTPCHDTLAKFSNLFGEVKSPAWYKFRRMQVGFPISIPTLLAPGSITSPLGITSSPLGGASEMPALRPNTPAGVPGRSRLLRHRSILRWLGEIMLVRRQARPGSPSPPGRQQPDSSSEWGG